MLSRLHSKLGTAGFIISIVALVAALGGGAYAASGGLSGKQKKEVEKIAKKSAGKPGANGAAGATGPAGPAGAPGAKGADGAAGTSGAGVTTKTIAPGVKCPAGGTEITSASGTTFACNGEEGEPGTTGFAAQLPSGETETGSWSIGKFTEEQEKSFTQTYAPISFPFPLQDVTGYLFEYVKAGGPVTANCKGTSETPTAEPGYLCIYEAVGEGVTFNGSTRSPGSEAEEEAPGKTGAVLLFSIPKKGGFAYGTWAVTSK
jgi:hypothetical protein